MKSSLVIFLIILLAGCSNYPDQIQFQGKTLNRYITVISSSYSCKKPRVYSDTLSYYADSTGMLYCVTSSQGEFNLFDKQIGDTLFYDAKGEVPFSYTKSQC